MAPLMLPPSLVNGTFGALLVSMILSTFIAGTSVIQFMHYLSHYQKDATLTRLAVTALWGLNMLDLVFSVHTAYHYLVTGFGDIVNALMLVWSIKANTLTTAILMCIVHVMYMIRIHTLGRGHKSVWVINALIAGLVVAGITVTETVSLRSQTFVDINKHEWMVIFPLGALAFVDALIAITLCVYLKPMTESVLAPNVILKRLMFYIISSGAITSVSALFAIALFVLYPSNLWWTIIKGILPRLYVTCFLTLLNSRESLRERLGSATVRVNPAPRPVPPRFPSVHVKLPSRGSHEGSESSKVIDVTSHAEAASTGPPLYQFRPLPPVPLS